MPRAIAVTALDALSHYILVTYVCPAGTGCWSDGLATQRTSSANAVSSNSNVRDSTTPEADMNVSVGMSRRWG